LCDVSPAALCNAFRYNYDDLEGCTILLDIGAKTSDLLFFENGRVFSRSINLGANSITQDFANEARLKFEVAEQIKVSEGFVSLGGAYEEPENPNQAAISKIARQFMTKLHIQVNQTMQFYRGQMGGGSPQRLFLAGGASVMPYTAQFFAEKLNVPVEYFNPFRNVRIDPSVNLEELARVAHSFGEVVGLGLRNLAHCPVEMNLMPASTLRRRAFNEKKPYFIATVFSLVVVAFAVGFLFEKLNKSKEDELDKLKPDVQQRQEKANQFNKVYAKVGAARQEADHIAAWMNDRYYWGDVLAELRRVLIRAENETQKKLSAQKPGVQAGIWIEQMSVVTPAAGGGGASTPNPGETQSATNAPGQTGQEAVITLVCRAVSLSSVDPSANSDIAYALQNELQASPYFDPKATQLSGEIKADDVSGTFTFGISVALKNPLNL
jgi:type IV pilus assembly protein PilM